MNLSERVVQPPLAGSLAFIAKASPLLKGLSSSQRHFENTTATELSSYPAQPD